MHATACVIWLHGLGADGTDFIPIVPELAIPEELSIRFVFPHAPVIPITINNGYRMRGWYDIKTSDIDNRADADGLAASVSRISRLITDEIANGIAPERILVVGFSQGGAVALHSALTYPQHLGGAIALSTYLPLTRALDTRLADANRTLPILQCHGTFDEVVAPALGHTARDWLVSRGYRLSWHEYPMDHSLCAAEVTEIGRWLAARLAS